MGLTPGDKKDLARSGSLGLLFGLLVSYSIYGSVLTWVPPYFVAMWVGGAILRARRAELRMVRRLGESSVPDA